MPDFDLSLRSAGFSTCAARRPGATWPAILLGWGLVLGQASGAVAQTLYDGVCQEAVAISRGSFSETLSPDAWQASLPERRRMWLEMIGLAPLPERTPLRATVTGVLERDGYVVEKVHFQSLPGVYVIGNLYRPARVSERLPAVLYLCGHNSDGKAHLAYQANPRWFAEHGYIALVLDPIQVGESRGLHHGTYYEGRWDWYSRGYTPLGTEVWNAMRALDYLETRPDVDAGRLGATGLSGGGVVSWSLAAADERIKVVAPVCQTGSVENVVVDRGIDGHCDCAFWINHYRWCWPDLGALIAPRALLIASGTEDNLWRPYAFRDVALRIHHQYARLGARDRFALVEDLTPHGYTPKLRQAIFTWFNTHLRGDPAPVTDDVTEFLEPRENLAVFAAGRPADERIDRVDTLLVKAADPPEWDGVEQWQAHQRATLARLRELTFRQIPAQLAPRVRDSRSDGGRKDDSRLWTHAFETGDGLILRVKTMHPAAGADSLPTVVYAIQPEARSGFGGAGASTRVPTATFLARPGFAAPHASAGVEVRNTSVTSVGPGYLWTARRVYPMLGQTLPERQVHDLLAGTAVIRGQPSTGSVSLYGQGHTAVLAVYAALLDPGVAELILADLPESHTDPRTPEFLGILRIGDLPDNLALLHPRPITFVGEPPRGFERTRSVYERLGGADRIRVIQSVSEWTPRLPAEPER